MSFTIPQYPELTVISDDDLLILEDVAAGNTKHVTRENLLSSAPLPADTVDEQAILNDAVTTNKLGDGAVTPDKRSGGFAIGSFSSPGTTGNLSVTGTGFTPRLVRFTYLPGSSGSNGTSGSGSMTATSQFATSATSGSGGNRRNSSTESCIYWVFGESTTPFMIGEFVSMDSDGFTINLTAVGGTVTTGWEAYA